MVRYKFPWVGLVFPAPHIGVVLTPIWFLFPWAYFFVCWKTCDSYFLCSQVFPWDLLWIFWILIVSENVLRLPMTSSDSHLYPYLCVTSASSVSLVFIFIQLVALVLLASFCIIQAGRWYYWSSWGGFFSSGCYCLSFLVLSILVSPFLQWYYCINSTESSDL